MSEFVKLEGALYWVKVDEQYPEPPFGEEKAGKWSAVIYPKPEGVELIRELQAYGLKNVLKKDENGYFIKFSCPVEIWRKDKETKQLKLIKKMKCPTLTGASSAKEIGNGSLGSLTLDVYEHAVPGSTSRKAKAARLYAVDITRLTPRT